MKDDREHKAFRRDKIIHNTLMMLMAVLLCVVFYLGFLALSPKPPAAPIEDNLAEPIIYVAPDNRKELILESTNDQN